MGRAELELQGVHLVQVADRPIGDHAGAPHRPVDIRLHFASKRPRAARIVQIVHDHEAGFGQG